MNKIVNRNRKKGFTLIELVVVIGILAVLALILVPSIIGYVNKANTAKNMANARSIHTSVLLVTQNTDFDAGPATGNVLEIPANYKVPAASPNVFVKELVEMVGNVDVKYSVTKVNDNSYIVEVGGGVTQGGVQFPE